MNEAEKLVAEFKEQLPEKQIAPEPEHLFYSLRETLMLVSDDIWYANKVLYREDITAELNTAYRSISKAMKLLKVE